jgi:NAD(P)-dependent dehydrogenase (short-subunit alcohol dehydrogenase family)
MTIEGKRIVLITGGMSLFSHGFSMSETDTPCTANAGIGFELAAQLLADPSKHILLGSRSIEKGEAAFKKLQERGLKGTVELVHINVIDGASIVAAVKSVGNKHGRYILKTAFGLKRVAKLYQH